MSFKTLQEHMVMDKLRVRIDDVLGGKEPDAEAEKRFAQISRWLEKTDRIIHVPAILVKNIEVYPSTIELIRQKTKEGKMFPQLHGWEHVNYNALSEEEIYEHHEKSVQWFESTLGFKPTVFITPWGAEGEKISKISKMFGMEVEGTKDCWDPAAWLTIAKRTNSLPTGVTVMDHWWKRGMRLQRIALCLKHGSFKEAKAVNPDVFGE